MVERHERESKSESGSEKIRQSAKDMTERVKSVFTGNVETLEEEKKIDETLTEFAETTVNPRAMNHGRGDRTTSR